MLPVVQAMAASERIEPFVVATGQHPGIVKQIFGAAGVGVDVDLEVGRPGITLNELFAAVLTRFQAFFLERFGVAEGTGSTRDYDHFPAACLVHGDTSSAAAGAVASFHLQVPVAHVEAGLRTSDVRSPFPEELNRQIISRIATFHLAPTTRNLENLVRENVPAERVFVTGNTAIDALALAASYRAPYGPPELDDIEDDEDTPVVVVTAHRRENWGGGLQRIATAIARLARRYPQTRFVLPVHPNPAVSGALRGRLDGLANVALVAPMGYLPFARLLSRATLVVTDSGGIQEEAPALGVPVLVMRDSTERQEGVDAGTLRLVGTDTDLIVATASRLLDFPEERRAMASRINPFGDGRASQRIVAAFEHIAFAAPPPQPFGAGFNRTAVLRAGGFDDETRSVISLPADPLEAVRADVEAPASDELVTEVLQS